MWGSVNSRTQGGATYMPGVTHCCQPTRSSRRAARSTSVLSPHELYCTQPLTCSPAYRSRMPSYSDRRRGHGRHRPAGGPGGAGHLVHTGVELDQVGSSQTPVCGPGPQAVLDLSPHPIAPLFISPSATGVGCRPVHPGSGLPRASGAVHGRVHQGHRCRPEGTGGGMQGAQGEGRGGDGREGRGRE